jgi:hypothetical protein
MSDLVQAAVAAALREAINAALREAIEQEIIRFCNAYAKNGNMIAATAIHDAWLCAQRILPAIKETPHD